MEQHQSGVQSKRLLGALYYHLILRSMSSFFPWLFPSSVSHPHHISWSETWQHLNKSWAFGTEGAGCQLDLLAVAQSLEFFVCLFWGFWVSFLKYSPLVDKDWLYISDWALCGDRDIKKELRMKTSILISRTNLLQPIPLNHRTNWSPGKLL